ncbi:hypothetical protein INR49_006295 [Caranx melampygus]|nr:hypothetical protein INR49_006295 [Caranx melampygus]
MATFRKQTSKGLRHLQFEKVSVSSLPSILQKFPRRSSEREVVVVELPLLLPRVVIVPLHLFISLLHWAETWRLRRHQGNVRDERKLCPQT